ncbi:large conductance mechanosensitive channel protein MscL [Apilactobacillus micheneri]|uniref:Large-conductance mechanosensitive channel n=1 Tax=Apilactobacillus micheneri TaxID=1899430 RepID=A0A9Q8MTN5_9LACO|nr:large conductance mechanosensitive channel protein MscL [Apilactobacillus micheneri]TPR38753.1 large conductance mechanosensitive channel protein MscL [Apilactobacillus micheneri]TPR41641.1 large conductance mechanosensitive channel protein MscL [Apilactobacillus micheneri]TPR42792.1 large conductance mechanosensitive channel protein MscL [Apilactobacillus micheneri]TPR42856.1 large conductance mechanosensitive channel protein MscL [Apilactobacillus micheneri]TPR43632.1 large conductance me
MFKDFKAFLSRGSVIDLAVGVIIGSAFTAIVKSLTTDLINPFLGLFLGQINLSGLVFSVGSAQFKVGSFIEAIINFIIIAFIIFLMVRAFNKLTKRDTSAKESKTDALLGEIRDLLKDEKK